MVATLVEIKPGQTLSTIAGQLYGNSSAFRDIADAFGINEFESDEQLVGRVLEVTEQIETNIKAKVEQIEGVLNLIEDGRFSEIDLSSIKTPDGLAPQQLISWLL